MDVMSSGLGSPELADRGTRSSVGLDRRLVSVQEIVDLAFGMRALEAIPLLNAPDELVEVPFHLTQFIVGQLRPPTLRFALHLLPLTLHDISVHCRLLLYTIYKCKTRTRQELPRGLHTGRFSKGMNSVCTMKTHTESMVPERKASFFTVSGRPVDRLYTSDSIPGFDYDSELGEPGTFPYTRGIHPTGYRGKLWTMRQFAGFGSPEDTNKRYRELLVAGATGLSVAFDLPSLMGRDADDPLAAGEVGRCGASISCLPDMELLFDGIPIQEITTSMTINAPAAMMLAMYLVLAERRQVAWDALSGTIQNDILKEFIAQKEYIFPPRASMRLVTDVFAFCAEHVPRWNTISVSGYHIREAGATASQELAFTLRDGVEYVQAGIDAGMPVDRFVPRMSFFFDIHNDFFEEIANFRAARRIWGRVMRDRFGARDERSMRLRVHAQTAGVSLTAQQPMNNVMRTAVQALAGVLGGTNSLHTCALDEALALPSASAAMLALRTQQILAFETGVAQTVDPFGGSYFVERLTRDLESEASAYFDKIDGMGGMIAAIERGYPQREIAESAYRFQHAVESGDYAIIGINTHAAGPDPVVPILHIDERIERDQVARLESLRRQRDHSRVGRALESLRNAATGTQNVMPTLLEAVRCHATVGEMCDVLRAVWGEYQEVPVI